MCKTGLEMNLINKNLKDDEITIIANEAIGTYNNAKEIGETETESIFMMQAKAMLKIKEYKL